ncbi:MAG: YdcF family protein [Ruminococcaceae bacterium]|nr:YdcF family protein [Oscillospiraceae bacterium]
MKNIFKTIITTSAIGSLSLAAYFKIAENACRNQMINPDYLIILGYGLKDDKVADILQMRIDAAADFLKNNPDTVAIPTGGKTHPGQTLSEAQAIKNGLMDKGIPEERIILEDQAKTTVENFINCKSIIQKRCTNINTERIAFMTSDFHVFRSSVICKQAGLDAVGLPVPSPEKDYKKNVIREFLVFPIMLIEKTKGNK